MCLIIGLHWFLGINLPFLRTSTSRTLGFLHSEHVTLLRHPAKKVLLPIFY